ncbi:Protein of unknown function [Bacillus toyonensis]
MREIQ